ncbi:nucleotidyltransferase family protein [Thalassospira sp.]|uniref:nucleotidyltransferase family protein n=1 Tax=Thalassospira sp. TaxID=1912094 RepID=UPI000C645834|nr:nucleotidyltransferase family protein [Thalassospira sp.]MBC07287.1 hypothetical protein [Thalassospira sp.]|tara:strand:- start:4580 stop:5158 length:579 start_codon:yes stop_codon:yes gene_type:complete
MTKLAGLLLAAGASERFGGRKQLAEISGKSFVRRATDLLAGTCEAAPFVVLGAYQHDIVGEVAGRAHIVPNPDWARGMGSSIAAGMRAIMEQASYCDGVLIAVCDQIRLDADDYQKLIDAFDGTVIVATRYPGGLGVPAIFPRSCWEELSELDGPKGAKEMINRKGQHVKAVDLPGALIDVDTKDDFAAAIA